MAQVFIPPPLQRLTNGANVVDVEGKTVREVIDNLEARFEGIKTELCDGEQIRPGIAVAVGTSVSSLGLLEKVSADSEVHFLPAISGG